MVRFYESVSGLSLLTKEADSAKMGLGEDELLAHLAHVDYLIQTNDKTIVLTDPAEIEIIITTRE